MAYDPSIFNINPYYDDFDANAGFLRVLFKPGYAVQARELTQLQSILQNQVSKLGDHIFKDGSRVVGGGISVRNASYIRIVPAIGVDYSTYVGKTVTENTTGNKAKIVHYLPPSAGSDNYVVFVLDFVSGDLFTESSLSVALTSTTSVTVQYATTLSATQRSGICKLVSISEGIFYVDGFFVRIDKQYFTPYLGSSRDLGFSGFSTLTKKIGFSVARDNITEQEDASLRDPAIGSYNYNAPGADRYKIVLTLSQTEIDETLDDFVELLRFESGKITKKIDRVNYGDIQKALAERTYDESGSYLVKPFEMTVSNHPTDASKLMLNMGEGKGYVYGYVVESKNTIPIAINRAQTTRTETDRRYVWSIGTWMGVSMGTSVAFLGDTFSKQIPTLTSGSSRVEFRNTSGAVIGSASVHGVLPIQGSPSNHYKLYLYGLSAGNGLSGASIGYIYRHSDGTTLAQFGPSGPPTALGFTMSGTNFQTLIFPFYPAYAGSTVNSFTVYSKLVTDDASNTTNPVTSTHTAGNPAGSVTYTIKKASLGGSIGSGTDSSTFSFPFDNTEFLNYTDRDIAIVNSSGAVYVPSTTPQVRIVGGTDIEFKVTDAPAGFTTGNLKAVVPVRYSIPDIRTNTSYRRKVSTAQSPTTGFLISNSISKLLTDPETGRKYYELPNLDVYSILSVSNNASSGVSYVDDFELDDGQRDTHYQNARLYLKESKETENRYSQSASAVVLNVKYLYFDHQGYSVAPFIGRHSYTNISYDQIPLYTRNRNAKPFSLASCVDFRRSGLTANAPLIKPYGSQEFGTRFPTQTTYSHFLPRVDKVCVKQDAEDGSALFFTEEGAPDLNPIAPPDPEDCLVLATITLPAYTHDPSHVVITPVENKRYTMSEIGKMDKRIDEVEVFAKLSASEIEIESRSMRGSTAQNSPEPLKTSIFSEEFYGHSISDVTENAFSCSVDFERGELRPFFTYSDYTVPTSIPSTTGTSANVAISSDGLLTLAFTGVTYINNSQYTKKIQVNPTNTVNWLGFMKLSAPIQPFFDGGYRPVVKTNALSENDNWISCNAHDDRGFGTQWNDWESIWTGIEEVEEEHDDIQKRIVELPRSGLDSAVPSFLSGSNRIAVSKVVETVDQKTSAFIRAKKLKNRIRYKIGSRVVDRSVVPYIPPTIVTGIVEGLKPNSTNLSLYFDGKVVRTGLSTGATGSCIFTFGISAGEHLVGSKMVRITDSTSTVAAETMYHCTGLVEQRDSGSVSTRPPEFRRQTTSSETISKDPFNREIDSVENTHWSDPLSQTFFVDKKATPEGIFLKSVTLYFSSKDPTLPVTVQIRPTVGGYPSPSVVLPFSTVTRSSTQVNANNVSPSPTVFNFSSPVYLPPGEYAICVLCNSDEYELYAAESAFNGFTTTSTTSGRAGNNQLVGTLFSPQGIGPAVPTNTTDIMFGIERCNFDSSSGSVTWNSISAVVNRQIFKIYAPEITPFDCRISRTVAGYGFRNNETVYPLTVPSSASNMTYSISRGLRATVSPVVDLSAMYFTAIRMFSPPYTATPTSRYISRVVELPEDVLSNGLGVFLDANIPNNSYITVHYRFLLNGESDITKKAWRSFPTTSKTTPTFTSGSEIDFREEGYRLSGLPLFKSYQIRVDLRSSIADPSYFETPAVRGIKVVSFLV